MKKIIIFLAISLLLGAGCTFPTFAQSQPQQAQTLQSPDLQQINKFLDKFIKYSNAHNLEGISSLYAQNYISGDGIKKDDLLNLLKDTWENYPNMCFSSDTKGIRINNDTASVESIDKSTAITGKRSEITNDIGNLESSSHNMLYLQKFGKEWKIVSDRVLYEKTVVKFGSAKTLNVDLNAPEQVYADDSYTASLTAEIPEGMFALGSIAKEPIVYPEAKPEEIFRQIPPETGLLERVMKANNTNNNEFASASVGYTEMSEDTNANPDIKLTGIALVLTRVNVIPKSTYVPEPEKPKTLEEAEPGENVLPDEPDYEENNQ